MFRSAGERAFEEIRHLIQLEEQDPDLKPLKLTLLLSSVLAGTLLLVLIGRDGSRLITRFDTSDALQYR